MNSLTLYSVLSKFYDLLDVFYFTKRGTNPRKAIMRCISDEPVQIVDLCCGTGSNVMEMAKEKKQANITGVDLSEPMLEVGKRKALKNGLKNLTFQCADATNTKMPADMADYVILGLFLHENSPKLDREILKEARRILKPDGTLLVLEWEKPKKLWRRIMFEPLRWMEVINCKTFSKFYRMDKVRYFDRHGFKVKNQYHCDYSIVLEMEKK